MQPPDGEGRAGAYEAAKPGGEGGTERGWGEKGRPSEAKRGQARRYEAICERGLTMSASRRGWAGRGGGSEKVDYA